MPTLTDKQALDFLSRLFPGGLGDPGLLIELCPEGWDASPLRIAFHPTMEQRYEEHLSWLRSPIRTISKRLEGNKDSTPAPIPTLEEFIAKQKPSTRAEMTADGELIELLGNCLWDILSDNHKPVTKEGEPVSFGSFRMVSSLIDEFIEGGPLSEDWGQGDHMRFYMGSTFVRNRTDLGTIYQMIFRRLQLLGYEWRYSFPRIYAVRFDKEPLDPADYDPSKAFAEEEKRRAEDQAHLIEQEQINRELAEAKRQAWDHAPPAVVLAYQEVFGKDPHGWPPDPNTPD